MEKETLIRERAYRFWELEGQPLGRDAAHWEQASCEIEAELRASLDPSQSGVNAVPEANVAVHEGPSSASPTPGFEPADGLSTPGIPPKRKE